jgi:hypothetical protein
MNNPYEIIKAFNTKEWNGIKDKDKAKNLFMINRIMSINFPLQANSFNHIKIQPEKVVDFWKVFMSHYYKKTPQWIWTKTQKGEKESSSYEYKEEVIDFIKEKYQISSREIKEMKNFFPKNFHSFYKEIEKILI